MGRINGVARADTMELAHAGRRWGSEAPCVIDYDIAMRSYRIRQRIAERATHDPMHANASGRVTLGAIVEESYRPGRSVASALYEETRKLGAAVYQHPFTQQLRLGETRGRSTGKARPGQVFASSAVCTVLASALIVIGL